eukprot:403354056
MNTVDEKQKIKEIQELFHKFDEKKTGTLKLEEIHKMFKSVGIEIQVSQIQQLFIHSARVNTNQQQNIPNQTLTNNQSPRNINGANFVKKKMTLKEFQEAMLSQKSNLKFKELIKKIRKQVKNNDYQNVSADIIFLPTDLGEMLSFLYRKTIQQQIKRELN